MQFQEAFVPWSKTEPTIEKNLKGWNLHEPHWERLLTNIDDPRVIEIGSFYGKLAHYLLSTYPNLSIICIDPWEQYEELIKYNMQDVFLTWEANLWQFRNRVLRMRMRGTMGMATLRSFVDLAPHIIYIDGAHDELNAYSDIAVADACFPKSKICGDDIHLPGVRRAVEAYAKLNGKQINKDRKFWEYL